MFKRYFSTKLRMIYIEELKGTVISIVFDLELKKYLKFLVLRMGVNIFPDMMIEF